jgi:hypothetical protein
MINLVQWELSNLLDKLYLWLNRRMLAQEAELKRQVDKIYDDAFTRGFELGKRYNRTETDKILEEADDILRRL